MKTKLLVLLSVLFFPNTKICAGEIPILYSNGVDIEKVLDLPTRDEFEIQAPNGRYYHGNLGIMHEQFSLFWIPLYNYGDNKYVLYSDVKNGDYDFTYVDLSRDDIEYLQSEIGGIPSNPELPFWDVWGGKLLVLAIIGGFWFFTNRNNQVESDE